MGVRVVSAYIPYKQFGYRRDCNYDKSYVIEEQTWNYKVTIDYVARRRGYLAGSRIIVYECSTLEEALAYIGKKL